MGSAQGAGGLPGSLRRLGADALELAGLRLELLATEVEREKLRLLRGLLLALAGAAVALVALMLLSLAAVLAADASHRLLVLLVLGAGYGLMAAWLLARARRALQAPPEGVFALTRAEWQRDRDALRPAPGP